MSRRRAPRVTAVLALLAALAAAGVVVVLAGGRPAPADDVVERFAAAWSAGHDRRAAAFTDQPARARADLVASRRGLDGARVTATVATAEEDGPRATGRLTVTWQVPGFPSWRYDTRVDARRGDGRWRIRWRPQTLHPRLERGLRLGTAEEAPDRGRILDRDGGALVAERPVLHIAVETRRVRDVATTAARLAALVDVDGRRLEGAIREAPRGRFVPVVTLREADAAPVRPALENIPGISLAADTAPLAPTRTFARAVLGSVGPATAEQIERSDGRLAVGDEIGQWGLQAAFERRLAGTPTRLIVVRDAETRTILDTLRRWPGRAPKPLRTTLDGDLQAAAEQAVGDGARRASLVAVQPSTGDLLAVANRPADSSLNAALTGLYPPGSTFKVISTAALIRDGLSVDATVPCPRNAVVGGRVFRNFEGSAHGQVPFRVDFAQSCNTAFVSLAGRLERTALTRAARDFGLGRTVRLPLPAADGSVPPPEDPVEHAAMVIGQGRILASPLQLAGVAATVADGRWRAPRLVDTDPRRRGPALPAGEVATLRSLMRDVVTVGTGQALAGLPGAVAGKSGTAEHGAGDPPPTHAWFIAFRGDLAVAVLVEGGRSGGSVAAPIATRFLAAAG